MKKTVVSLILPAFVAMGLLTAELDIEADVDVLTETYEEVTLAEVDVNTCVNLIKEYAEELGLSEKDITKLCEDAKKHCKKLPPAQVLICFCEGMEESKGKSKVDLQAVRVEIGKELKELAKEIKEAREELEEELKEKKFTAKEKMMADEVLTILLEYGIPVEHAYEAVEAALERIKLCTDANRMACELACQMSCEKGIEVGYYEFLKELKEVEHSGICELQKAFNTKNECEAKLMNIQGVTGIGAGECKGEICIIVTLESDSPDLIQLIPSEINGIKVITKVTGRSERLPAEPLHNP